MFFAKLSPKQNRQRRAKRVTVTVALLEDAYDVAVLAQTMWDNEFNHAESADKVIYGRRSNECQQLIDRLEIAMNKEG